MRLDWIFLPRENPCAKFCIIIIIIIINTYEGWGAGEEPKNYSRKGKVNEKKFMHAN